MNVTVALDARYAITPDGTAWSQLGMARQFWERYLEVFDRVSIVARVGQVERVPDDWQAVNGKDILFRGIPDFHGPWQCLKQYPALRAAVRSATPSQGAVILRVGSQIANMLEPPLLGRGHPYALEVVGDPYEVFAPGIVNHPLRPFFRWHFSRRLRRQCLRATGVAYVTKRALQARYPARSMTVSISDINLPAEAILGRPFSENYSNVELDARQFAVQARQLKEGRPYRLVTVGSLAQLYKGTDVLIDAIARCVRAGMDLTAVIAGDGKYRTSFMAQAQRAGISSRIEFPGWVSAGEPVRRVLDQADLFVLPSRTEGLPRALVEAMARALPCIGSAVGGVPELLDADDMVLPDDSAALARKIDEVLKNPSRMKRMSQRNLTTAWEFCDTVLGKRRRRFYQHVRTCTEEWERHRKN